MLVIITIKNAQVKYDTIGRHYFLFNGQRWERVGLKAIANTVGLSTIEVASFVKYEQTKIESKGKDTVAYKLTWDLVAYVSYLLRRFGDTRHYKEKLIYYKSKLWWLGRRLGFPDEHITRNLDYAASYYKVQTE